MSPTQNETPEHCSVRMRRCTDVIYPVGIIDYLEPIMAGDIPEKPLEIILDRKPRRTLIQGGI